MMQKYDFNGFDPRIGERPRNNALVLVKLILSARQKIAQEAEKDDQPRDEDKDLRHDKFFLYRQ